MFIGRKQELQFFNDKYNAPGSQLVVLYGRWRIGKTDRRCKEAPNNTIIEAIALGNTQLNDIYTKTQIEKSKISVYLKILWNFKY